MSGVCFNRRLFLLITPILAALWLCACTPLPALPDEDTQLPPTRPATQISMPTMSPATPSTTPSLPATLPFIAPLHPTETITPTEPPLAISIPGLGYDCSQVERLPVASPEARRLAEALVTSYKEKLPTEYIAVEDLWSVERLGEYIVLQMRVTDEAAGIFVIQETPTSGAHREYEYLSGQVWGGWPLPSRFTFPEYFTNQLPDAPPELFYCMSQGHYFFQILPQEELDLRRHVDCALVQSIQVDSPMGWPISHSLVDYWSDVIDVATVELDQVYSIQQLGRFYAIQVRFLINHRSEPPEIFIAKDTAEGYQFLAQTGGGGPDRSYVLRTLYAQDPSIPAELLACLNLDGWLLDTPTPAP